MSGMELTRIKVANVKDIIYEGIKHKVDSQGNLRTVFDISLEYPTRETFQTNREGNRRHVRRIVIKKLNNTVSHYAIGQIVGGEVILDPNASEGMRDEFIQGWLDDYMIEISIWTPDSKDRDNIVDLIKLWMLELEQDILSGNLQLELPYFFNSDVFAVRFIRSYDDINYNLTAKEDGPMYIGSLVYEVKAPFFHRASPDYLEQYKIELEARIIECITIENQS